MNSKISDKDKKDWKNFLSSDEKLPNKDEKLSNKKTFSIKSFDLHGYSLDEANETINQLVKDSYEKGIKKLVIVTGKGLHSTNDKDIYVSKNLGTFRYSVPEFIKSNEELNNFIISIKEADIKDGGEGALLIKLKNL